MQPVEQNMRADTHTTAAHKKTPLLSRQTGNEAGKLSLRTTCSVLAEVLPFIRAPLK